MNRCWLIVLLANTCANLHAAQPEVVAGKLDHPMGVAVQPATGDVFVSESGKGRIVRVVGGAVETAVAGFTPGTFGDEPSYQVSPLGLGFLGNGMLLAGTGDRPAGQDELLVLPIGAAGEKARDLSAAATRYLVTSSDPAQSGGNFTGICSTAKSVFAVCQDSGDKGWMARISVQAGQAISFERYLATSSATGVASPYALTTSPRGDVIVSQIGKLRGGRDSHIAFFGAVNRQLLLDTTPGLYDVTGLAFGADGQLYATDLAWEQPDQGGLFQIVSVLADGKQSAEARRVATIERPTGLAAGKDGILYITSLGGGSAAVGSDTGTLWKFNPGPK